MILRVLPSDVVDVGRHNERGDDQVLLLVSEADCGLDDGPGCSPDRQLHPQLEEVGELQQEDCLPGGRQQEEVIQGSGQPNLPAALELP